MKKILLYLFFTLNFSIVHAQTIAKFEIDLLPPPNTLTIPLSINLDEFTFLSDSILSLIEIRGTERIPIPFQIEQSDKRILHWQATVNIDRKHSYELRKGVPQKFNDITYKNENGALVIQSANRKLLSYIFKTVYPPAGIDTNYKRSAFIHPLWAPHGQELTRIQAPDHYHHYGIWNPWTHVFFEGDTVDFWNIKEKQGTVRFSKFISQTAGNVFSQFEALHEHVVFKKNGEERVALNELQTVRVYKPQDNSDYFIVDITSKMNCASESPFLIVPYRYAGMGWRTTEYWDNNNCEVLTSEGKNRDNTDGSKAKWCVVQGALPGNDSGGVAFLSYPANYNHPEPIRIWTKNTNGRGDMFFNFAPTKDKSWLLKPGKTYVLKYRMIVFNGKFDSAMAEKAWRYFAEPSIVRVKK